MIKRITGYYCEARNVWWTLADGAGCPMDGCYEDGRAHNGRKRRLWLCPGWGGVPCPDEVATPGKEQAKLHCYFTQFEPEVRQLAGGGEKVE